MIKRNIDGWVKEKVNGKQYAVGLDLGGTKILAALIDDRGKIIHRVERQTRPEEGADAVVDRVMRTLEQVTEPGDIPSEEIKGVGVASAGVIDSEENCVLFANNLGWTNVPIGKMIEERFGFRVRINNDANVAALAEWMWGRGKGKRHVIYITVSTGIGAGIISEGRIIQGVSNSAGEFGHMSVNVEGPPCACGNRGCLENYASGLALARQAKERLHKGEHSLVFSAPDSPRDRLTSKELADAAASGDPFSIRMFENAAYYLGAGITNLIHLFNPEVVVLGGGVMNMSEILLPRIRQTVKERCIPDLWKKTDIELTSLGSEIGVLGGAGLFFKRENS